MGVNTTYGSSSKVDVDTWTMLVQQARVFELSYIASITPMGATTGYTTTGTSSYSSTGTTAKGGATATTSFSPSTAYNTYNAYDGATTAYGRYNDSYAGLYIPPPPPPTATIATGGGGGRAELLFEKLSSHVTG